VSWVEVFIVLLVSHLAGDFLLQTEWQATNKPGGMGRDPIARRALASHILTYTLAFVPALIWIAVEQGVAIAVGAAALIALPHFVIDDGRLVAAYMRGVKGANPSAVALTAAVDQSSHVICLWAVALLVVA
jgi:hypothetical protein